MFKDVCEFNVNLMTIKLLWVRSSNKIHTLTISISNFLIVFARPPAPLHSTFNLIKLLHYIHIVHHWTATLTVSYYLIEQSGTLLPQWFRIYLFSLMLSFGDMSNGVHKVICWHTYFDNNSPQAIFDLMLTTDSDSIEFDAIRLFWLIHDLILLMIWRQLYSIDSINW